MAADISLEEDGFISVEMKDKDGAKISALLDLYLVHNDLFDLRKKYKAGAEDSPTPGQVQLFHQAVREYLATRGFPACSDRMAVKFVEGVAQAIAKKNEADLASKKPDSPSSTDSTSLT